MLVCLSHGMQDGAMIIFMAIVVFNNRLAYIIILMSRFKILYTGLHREFDMVTVSWASVLASAFPLAGAACVVST